MNLNPLQCKTQKIAVASDLHLLSKSTAILNRASPYSNSKDTFACIANGDYDAVFCLGDISHDNSTQSYINYLSLLHNIPCHSKLCIPGNHDSIFFKLIPTLNQARFGYCYSYARYTFIFIDTVISGCEHGLISSNDLSFIEHLALNNDQNLVIFMHHPPIKIGSTIMDPLRCLNGNKLIELLYTKEFNVDIVFGHVHGDYSSVQRNIRFNSVISAFRQYGSTHLDSPDAFYYGYNVLSFEQHGLVIEKRVVSTFIPC